MERPNRLARALCILVFSWPAAAWAQDTVQLDVPESLVESMRGLVQQADGKAATVAPAPPVQAPVQAPAVEPPPSAGVFDVPAGGDAKAALRQAGAVRGTVRLQRGGVWNQGLTVPAGVTITAYGQGPRPIVAPPGGQYGTAAIRVAGADVTVRGLDLRAPERDWSAAGFSISRTKRQVGVEAVGDTDRLTVDDCVIRWFSVGIGVQGWAHERPFPVADDIAIRDTVIRDSWHESGHAQGIYAESINGLTIERCVIDRGGWAPGVPGAEPDIFQHAMYLQTDVSGVIIDGCAVIRPAAHGVQVRLGGTVRNSLWAWCPMAIMVSRERGVVTGNVIIDGVDMDHGDRPWPHATDPHRGWGVDVELVVGEARVEGNIMARRHPTRTSNGWAVAAGEGNYKASSGFSSNVDWAAENGPVTPVAIRGNTAHDWRRGTVARPLPTIYAADGRAATIGPNDIDPPDLRDPTRSLESWAATKGSPATTDAAVDLLAADTGRIADVMAYIREGFERTGQPTQATTATVQPAPTPIPAVRASNPGLEILPGAPRAEPWLRNRTLEVILHGRDNHGPASAAEVRWTDPQGREILGAIAVPPGRVQLWVRDWQIMPDGGKGHTWWAGTAGADGELDLWMERAVVGITRAVEAHYGTRGRVIHGISMGGGGALRIGWGGRRLGMDWDAVRADVPALLHSSDTSHGGEAGTARLRQALGRDITPAEIAQLDLLSVARERGATLPPTWIALGTEDPSVSSLAIDELVTVAVGNGANITLHRGEGEGHRAGQDSRFSAAYDAAWRGLFSR